MFNKTGCGIQTATKIGQDVQIGCESVCTNFDRKRITYKKSYSRKPMDPSSKPRAWTPSVLNLRGLWFDSIVLQ